MVPLSAICYVEIVTNEVEQVRTAHERCHGWRFTATPALGNAFVAELPDGSRYAVRAPMHAAERPLTRAYVRVEDIDRAAEAARLSGGFLALPPMEIPGHGRIAIYMLGGVEHGLWQLP
jgi:predicted enzyme related to lactoylglutathione lyase